MNSVVRLGLIQQQGLVSDTAENVAELLANIDRLGAECELICATELATTPYFPVVHHGFEGWAESADGPLVNAVAERARRFSATIVLPVFLRQASGYSNSALVIGTDGELLAGVTADGLRRNAYDKVHLPDAWHEGRGLDEPYHFARGNAFPVFDTPVGRLGVLICYDRRFPEAWRSLVFAGAEIVLVPSCVPNWSPSALASTSDMFVTELRTRACESVVFVGAVNRAGIQEFRGVTTQFVGKSCVIDPGGALLAEASGDQAENLIVDIDLEELTRIRKRLTVMRDRRPDAYVYQANRGTAWT